VKRLLSVLILISLGLSVLSPVVHAEEGTPSVIELRRAQREIMRELRKERHQPSKLSQLREELEEIRAVMKALREERRQQRREVRKRKLALRKLQRVEEPASPAAEEPSTASRTEHGKASYYADKFNGRTTASGAIFSNNSLTAAHKTLPFGTRVKVTNPDNGNSVEVVINDRGPFVAGRVIDLSSAAFARLDSLSRGVIDVHLEIFE